MNSAPVTPATQDLASRLRRLGQLPMSRLYTVAGMLGPGCRVAAAALGAVGLVAAFAVAVSDDGAGQAWRIAFVHLPTAWLSVLTFATLTACSALALLPGARCSAVLAGAILPTCALLCALALWTAAMWSRPAAGTWWSGQGALVDMLWLLGLCLAALAMPLVFEQPVHAERAAAWTVLTGLFPLGDACVALLGPAGLRRGLMDATVGAPALDGAAGATLALTTLALGAWCAAAVLQRARAIVLERERAADWVRALQESRP